MRVRCVVLVAVMGVMIAERGAAQRLFPQPEIPAFWKGRVDEVDAAATSVKRGTVSTITVSPGGRAVRLVAYGEKVVSGSQANYGSACGAGDPRFYARKDADAPPVIFIVGPVHGQEVEGMVGLVNLLAVAESGRDLRGKEWPGLRAAIGRTRLLVVPLSNPDGRARCPYDTFIGISADEMERVGQGTRADGTHWGWPGVKARHPMRGDVGLLGAYFNDGGVNLMHDEFFAPMAEETKALLRVAREEAPDYVLLLHSHGESPQLLGTTYVPQFHKKLEARFAARLMARYRAAGLPAGPVPVPSDDGASYPPPSFNLTSALHHVSGAFSMLFECPHGLKDEQYPKVTFDAILDLQLILYEELLRFAMETPRPIPPGK